MVTILVGKILGFTKLRMGGLYDNSLILEGKVATLAFSKFKVTKKFREAYVLPQTHLTREY